MSNPNRKMISTAIQRLLEHADSELEAVKKETGPEGFGQSWIVHMTASLLCSIAVDVLMDIRKEIDKDQIEEKPTDVEETI